MREKRQFEVGRVLHVQDDSFTGKDNQVVQMTRLKLYFGEGATAGVADLNFIWEGGIKPKFLSKVEPDKMAVVPVVLKAFNGELKMQGDLKMDVSETVWNHLLAGRK